LRPAACRREPPRKGIACTGRVLWQDVSGADGLLYDRLWRRRTRVVPVERDVDERTPPRPERVVCAVGDNRLLGYLRPARLRCEPPEETIIGSCRGRREDVRRIEMLLDGLGGRSATVSIKRDGQRCADPTGVERRRR
jgi:hypothetical protein